MIHTFLLMVNCPRSGGKDINYKSSNGLLKKQQSQHFLNYFIKVHFYFNEEMKLKFLSNNLNLQYKMRRSSHDVLEKKRSLMDFHFEKVAERHRYFF